MPSFLYVLVNLFLLTTIIFLIFSQFASSSILLAKPIMWNIILILSLVGFFSLATGYLTSEQHSQEGYQNTFPPLSISYWAYYSDSYFKTNDR